MQVRIDHLDANPFRHIDRYPIREDKVAALIESINTTGFWDNMVGRAVGDRVQIAYGHHRRESLIRTFGPDHEIGIVVRDFNDDQMLKIMARENMEEWGSSASVEHETVRAVVEAYAAGCIELDAPARDASRNQLRHAPSFVMGDARRTPAARPYTAQAVADFLGWHHTKVKNALQALALIEREDVELTDDDFVGLSTSAAEALVRETNATLDQQQRQRKEEARRIAELEAARAAAAEREAQAAREREAARERARIAQLQAERDRATREADEQARRVARAAQERAAAERASEAAAREVARREAERTRVRQDVTSTMRTRLRDPRVGIDNARKEAQATRAKYAPADGAPMDFGRFVRGLASRLSRLLTSGDYADALAQIRRHRVHIPVGDGDQLIAALEDMRTIIDTHLALLGAADSSPDVEIIDAELAEWSDHA